MTADSAPPLPPLPPPRRRIGVMGGSFDPVHNGHLQTARTAADHCRLERVVWIPGATPPHKQGVRLADAADRLAMLSLAIASDPRFAVSTMELDRGGVSYTIDTIITLRREHPDWDPWLIIGMDSLRDLPSWYRAAELLDLCTVVTVGRPGVPTPRELPGLTPAQRARVLAHLLTERVLDVSSTDIRSRIAQRRSIRYLVPDEVAAYIRAHRLYHPASDPHPPTRECRHHTA